MKRFELGTQELEEFEETVRAISDLAFAYGIKKVGTFVPRSASEQERRQFVTACHEGYALAQKRIVSELLQLEGELRLVRSNLKKARGERRRPETERLAERLGVLELKRVILRKIGDVRAGGPLTQALKDKDSDVRESAKWALGGGQGEENLKNDG